MTSTPTCQPWCTDHVHDFDICTGPDAVLDFGPRGDHPIAGRRIVADLSHSATSTSIVLHIDDAPAIDLDPDGALAIGWALISQATMASGDIAAALYYRELAQTHAAAAAKEATP
jgi:hypothetical protein